ncbi:MAG: UDP-2,4-diacetamido-2,4,6-trideoxy-beta-L-altropyranose hydrolase [Bacteroidales bacterium]|nr:UDP-2,4-diacetamido-2,4,6-trideoxy-beta-L-altropyranose hydrolase [Bacteroidales bacterium]
MRIDNRRIIFRADGGQSIGMGHITRLMAMAAMINDGFTKIFATRNRESGIVRDINLVVDEYICLPEGKEHFGKFLSFLAEGDVVVLDNYFFSTEYQRLIRDRGCFLVCLDDMHDRHYVADLIINHAPGIEPGSLSTEPYTKVCLGLDYALLRKNFLDAAKQEYNIVNSNTVFICFGGVDNNNNTLKVINALYSKGGIADLIVVVGSQYAFYNNLQDFVRSKNGIRIFQGIDAIEMVDLLKKSRLAIVPASTILLETLCFNIKIISGYYIDNQRNLLSGAERFNNVLNIGNFDLLDSHNLWEESKRMLADPSRDSIRPIDGLSGDRISGLLG